jgi:hypothetical protein
MRLSIAYASAKVCRLAIESTDSLDYSVSRNLAGTGVGGHEKSPEASARPQTSGAPLAGGDSLPGTSRAKESA